VLTSKPYLIVFPTLFVIKRKKLFILFDIFLTTRCLFLDILWDVLLVWGGMQLGLFDRIAELFAEIEESL